jgi:hypothetical protein
MEQDKAGSKPKPPVLTRYEIVPDWLLISHHPDKSGEILYTESMTLGELLKRVELCGGGLKDQLTFETTEGRTFTVSEIRYDKDLGEIILEGE